jgi:hypothetical protein
MDRFTRFANKYLRATLVLAAAFIGALAIARSIPVNLDPNAWEIMPPLSAQTAAITLWGFTTPPEPAFASVTADDSDVAMLVKYIGPVGASGTTNSGTVQIAASSALFKSGAQGAETNAATDPTCPGGGTNGTIDFTNAACDTLGEMVDIINATTTWRAVLVAGFRSDFTYSTTVRLVALAATRATTPDGVQIKFKTANNLTSSLLVAPGRFTTSISSYLAGGSAGQPRAFISNPFYNRRSVLLLGNALSTYASGTSIYNIYSVLVKDRPAGAAGVGTGSSETVSLLYSDVGGASTVLKAFDFRDIGIASNRNEKMIVRLTNSVAMSVTNNRAYGIYGRTEK